MNGRLNGMSILSEGLDKQHMGRANRKSSRQYSAYTYALRNFNVPRNWEYLKTLEIIMFRPFQYTKRKGFEVLTDNIPKILGHLFLLHVRSNGTRSYIDKSRKCTVILQRSYGCITWQLYIS